MKNEIKVSVVGIKTYPAGNGKNSTIITVALDSNNNITAEMSLYSNNTIGDSVNVFVEGKKVAYVGCAFAEKPYSVMKSVSRDYKYRNLSWSLNNAGWHSKSLAMSWEGEIKKEYRTANKYFLAILAEWGLTLEDIYAMSNVAIETLMNIRESTIETDGTEDDADEENVAMTIDHNFDVEEEDDELVDEPSGEYLKAQKDEIVAVTAVNTNYASGVYRWYYKNFEMKAQAFKYLWSKRGKYKGTTEFIFQIEVNGQTVFNWDSAARNHALEIKDEEIKNLYENAKVEMDSAASEEKIYYRTNRGNVKEVKIAETFGTTPQKRWYIYHEIAGLPEENIIARSLEDEGSEFVTQLCKFIANDTDGSNDDGEEENLTADYNFDVEEEDDELVDEAEVAVTAEEDNTTATEVQEVAKAAEELFAYGVQANRPVFGSVPSGYVKIDKYETEFKIRGVGYVFAVAYYEKPLEEKDIIGYDLVDIAAKRKAYEALHTPEAMAKAEEERKEHHKQLIKERIMRNCAAFEKGLREIDAKIAKLQDEMFSLSGTEETKKELDKLIVKRGKIATNYENEKAELASLEDEVDVTEYAVSPDAQEVAVQAEVDNAAREVAVEEVIATADLEKQLKNVQKSRYLNECFIEDVREDIKYAEKIISDCYKTIAEFEKAKIDNFRKLGYYFKENGRLQASVEELQTKITNRKLNAVAVGMVDDGTNEEDAEEMTVDYNFDDEDSDDELIDPPIEYHIEFEIPAAVELVPVTFALERFGEDSDNAAMREELEDEINCKLAAIAGLEKEVAELREKLKAIAPVDEDERIFELELRYCDLQTEMGDIDAEIEDYLNTAVSEVEEICQKVVKKKITLVTYDGKRYEINPEKKSRMYVCRYVDAEAKLRIYVNGDEVEGYGKIADFKAVMKDLEAAIEHGDKEFALPCGDKNIRTIAR